MSASTSIKSFPLPTELIEHMLNFLEASTLAGDISKVCRKWEQIAGKIMERRISEMMEYFSTHSDQLDEIRSLLLPEQKEDYQKILEIYESAFLKKNFVIKSEDLLSNSQVDDFAAQVLSSKDCDCKHICSCFLRGVHWMPCHGLILVQKPEKIEFYPMSALLNKEGLQPPLKYDTVLLGSTDNNVKIHDDIDTAISVFQDKVVCQETTRALILFRVKEVSHLGYKTTVVLENIRRIFLPLWSCDVILLEKKVCILFTTGSVGIWRMQENDIQLSVNTCADADRIRRMRLSKMYACKNLVIVKIVTARGAAYWSIFDSNDMQPTLQTLDLNKCIVKNFLRGDNECNLAFEVFVSTNAFIVHCQVYVDDPRDPVNLHFSCPAIFCRRLKKNPTLEDFQSPKKFNLLFHDDWDDSNSEDRYKFCTVSEQAFLPPILSSFIKDSHTLDVVTLVGIRDPRKKQINHPSYVLFDKTFHKTNKCSKLLSISNHKE